MGRRMGGSRSRAACSTKSCRVKAGVRAGQGSHPAAAVLAVGCSAVGLLTHPECPGWRSGPRSSAGSCQSSPGTAAQRSTAWPARRGGRLLGGSCTAASRCSRDAGGEAAGGEAAPCVRRCTGGSAASPT
jgi:hypothetical protein